MPKKSLIPVQIPDIQLETLLHSQSFKDKIPFHKPRTRFCPIPLIVPKELAKPETIAAMIFGMAATTPEMMAGRLETMAVNSFTPAEISCGMEEIRKLTIDLISFGSRLTSSGIESMIPLASASTSFSAAFKINGRLSAMVASKKEN